MPLTHRLLPPLTRRRVLTPLTLAVLGVLSVVVIRRGPNPETTVRAWLLCDDCSDGELDKVLALDRRAIAVLVASLESGPDSQQQANVRMQALSDAKAANRVGEKYGEIAAIDTIAFTNRYVTSYVNTYRERALLALTAIKDTTRVKEAIDSLLALDAISPLGWTDSLRAAVRAYRTLVTELRILPIPDLRVGQTRHVRVQIVGGDPNARLTWSSSADTVASVDTNRVVTGHGKGVAIVKACWAPQGGGEAICAIRAVRVIG